MEQERIASPCRKFNCFFCRACIVIPFRNGLKIGLGERQGLCVYLKTEILRSPFYNPSAHQLLFSRRWQLRSPKCLNSTILAFLSSQLHIKWKLTTTVWNRIQTSTNAESSHCSLIVMLNS